MSMNAALIIAAGKTARKDNFEPLKEVGTITAIQRIVMVFKRAGIERIVVVCNEDEDKTEKIASRMNVVFLHGHGDAEMLDNVKTGLAYLRDKCSAAIITHVDVPLFSVETVRALVEAEGPVCIPFHRGSPGHPMLLRSEHFQAVLSYSGDGGLEAAVNASGLKRNIVEVEDEGVIANIRAEEAYEHLLAGHDLTKLHPDIRIRLVREKPFYGPGAQQLLQLTEETGSLREACRCMGISYSKGRKITSLMEEQLGYPIIESQQGGKTGGHSVVTKESKELMHNYSEFCAEAERILQELFLRYFSA